MSEGDTGGGGGGGDDDDDDDLGPDAGVPVFDAGAVHDAGPFLDGPPPDAAALLPDAGTPFP